MALSVSAGVDEMNNICVKPLTDREEEVMLLLLDCRVASNREIAERLFLSLVTVNVYVQSIYNKLGLHGQARHRVNAIFVYNKLYPEKAKAVMERNFVVPAMYSSK